jgi:hypothetical protein
MYDRRPLPHGSTYHPTPIGQWAEVTCAAKGNGYWQHSYTCRMLSVFEQFDLDFDCWRVERLMVTNTSAALA